MTRYFQMHGSNHFFGIARVLFPNLPSLRSTSTAMDIPLSSDALDIAHHPDTQKNILVAGLISGKVQLINYDRTAERTSSTGELHQDPDAKGYSKLWTARPSNKSCRGVSFHPGTRHDLVSQFD